MALLRLTTQDNTELNFERGNNMIEYTLWAHKIGQEEWAEDVITSTTDVVHLENAKIWATANGFDRLRVIKFDFEKPDFVKAINI